LVHIVDLGVGRHFMAVLLNNFERHELFTSESGRHPEIHRDRPVSLGSREYL